MRLIVTSIVAGAIALHGGHVEAKTTWKSKVDGKTFRITLDDNNVVNVVDKSIITSRNMELRDQMRAAVVQATGCEIVDELWFDAKMKGKFSCPEGQVPRDPAPR